MSHPTDHECAICSAYGLDGDDAGRGVHEIEHDPVRDGLRHRRVYACDECHAQITSD